MWKSLILPHQDYCSVLWAPVSNKTDILAQEGPQRAYTKQAWGLRNTHYWDRLKIFKLYSMQRRVERFKMIYIWKMLNGFVPDIGLVLNTNQNTRSANILVPKNVTGKSEAVKTKLRDSLLYNGVRIYNCLPKYVTSVTDCIDTFKKNLDLFLGMLPDQPELPGSIPEACDLYGNPSNSLIDWVRHIGLDDDIPPDIPPDGGEDHA